jgi:hypothetical protein
MGMAASILAIGPFSREVVHALPYSTSHYAQTREGVRVIAKDLFQVSGNDASQRLAACLGISDAWDFNQHQVDSARVDLDAIRVLLEHLGGATEYWRDFKHFPLLREAGFEFYFQPNG